MFKKPETPAPKKPELKQMLPEGRKYSWATEQIHKLQTELQAEKQRHAPLRETLASRETQISELQAEVERLEACNRTEEENSAGLLQRVGRSQTLWRILRHSAHRDDMH